MNKKLQYAAIAAATLVILGLIWALVIVASNSNTSSESPARETPTTVTRTLSGKTLAEDKADAYAATVELLNATEAPTDQEELFKLLEELDASGTEAVPVEFLNRVRFVDTMDDDSLKKTLYQTTLTFATLAKVSGEGEIASSISDPSERIFLDQEVGVANVPLNLFVPQGNEANTFSLELVYVDGEWKLSPYTVLDQLRLSLGLQQAALGAEE